MRIGFCIQLKSCSCPYIGLKTFCIKKLPQCFRLSQKKFIAYPVDTTSVSVAHHGNDPDSKK